MKKEFEIKLNKIADIWNYFILPYSFCSLRIKCNDDIKTNYFGDILGYFQDTISIVNSKKLHSNHIDKFTFTISFLQAIYVQQDFIEEMLEIFKTGVDKGDLKNDLNYSINRDIRNELIGHPIRKSGGKLISSTLFSYQANEEEIEYLRYHRDNNFEYESKCFKIVDIQKRHEEFLEKYFDIILVKLKNVLDEYFMEINKLEKVIENGDFKTVLKLVELYFEYIFKSDFVYDKVSLIKIYNKRKEHKRYQNFIDKFLNDLTESLVEKRTFAKNILEKKKSGRSLTKKSTVQNIKIVYVTSDDHAKDLEPKTVTYHYEIGKIATGQRDLRNFQFFGGILKSKCLDNSLVLEELEHMEQNISDEVEYYTSLRLICKDLKE